MSKEYGGCNLLLIGLGGTGIDMAFRVAKRQDAVYSRTGNAPNASVVLVDTDKRDLENGKVRFRETTLVPTLAPLDPQYAAPLRYPQNESFQKILRTIGCFDSAGKIDTRRVDILKRLTSDATAARQTPALSRAPFMANFNQLAGLFRQKGNDLLNIGRNTHIGAGLQIAVFCSSFGGTGAGLALPTLYALRKELGSVPKISLYLFDSSFAEARDFRGDDDFIARARANSYMIEREIDVLQSVGVFDDEQAKRRTPILTDVYGGKKDRYDRVFLFGENLSAPRKSQEATFGEAKENVARAFVEGVRLERLNERFGEQQDDFDLYYYLPSYRDPFSGMPREYCSTAYVPIVVGTVPAAELALDWARKLSVVQFLKFATKRETGEKAPSWPYFSNYFSNNLAIEDVSDSVARYLKEYVSTAERRYEALRGDDLMNALAFLENVWNEINNEQKSGVMLSALSARLDIKDRAVDEDLRRRWKDELKGIKARIRELWKKSKLVEEKLCAERERLEAEAKDVRSRMESVGVAESFFEEFEKKEIETISPTLRDFTRRLGYRSATWLLTRDNVDSVYIKTLKEDIRQYCEQRLANYEKYLSGKSAFRGLKKAIEASLGNGCPKFELNLNSDKLQEKTGSDKFRRPNAYVYLAIPVEPQTLSPSDKEAWSSLIKRLVEENGFYFKSATIVSSSDGVGDRVGVYLQLTGLRPNFAGKFVEKKKAYQSGRQILCALSREQNRFYDALEKEVFPARNPDDERCL